MTRDAFECFCEQHGLILAQIGVPKDLWPELHQARPIFIRATGSTKPAGQGVDLAPAATYAEAMSSRLQRRTIGTIQRY